MGLNLGKQFNRNYNVRIPFLDGFYNIGIFFDKRSTFLLFSVNPDFTTGEFKQNVVNMYKNLEASIFCETFLELHNYRKHTLDISNQFEKIKPEYSGDLSFVFNETLTLAKIDLEDKAVYDLLNIYAPNRLLPNDAELQQQEALISHFLSLLHAYPSRDFLRFE